MPQYMHYDYNQTSMVVINFEEQIQPGTFEYALHHLISDRLDLTPFDELYSNDGKAGGRPAYDPAILLKIILFAYSKGPFYWYWVKPRDSVVLRAQYYF